MFSTREERILPTEILYKWTLYTNRDSTSRDFTSRELSEPADTAIHSPSAPESNHRVSNGQFLSDSDSTDRLGTVSRPDTERDTDTAALLDSLGPDIDDAELCVCPSLASDTPVGKYVGLYPSGRDTEIYSWYVGGAVLFRSWQNYIVVKYVGLYSSGRDTEVYSWYECGTVLFWSWYRSTQLVSRWDCTFPVVIQKHTVGT